jgi:hypothetical protein
MLPTDKACQGRLGSYSLTVHGEGYLKRTVLPSPQPLSLLIRGNSSSPLPGERVGERANSDLKFLTQFFNRGESTDISRVLFSSVETLQVTSLHLRAVIYLGCLLPDTSSGSH